MSAVPARPTEHAFAHALLDPALPPPAGLVAWNGSDPAPRFAVYCMINGRWKHPNIVHSRIEKGRHCSSPGWAWR